MSRNRENKKKKKNTNTFCPTKNNRDFSLRFARSKPITKKLLVCSSLRYWNSHEKSAKCLIFNWNERFFKFFMSNNWAGLIFNWKKVFGSQWALQINGIAKKKFAALKFGQVMWGFKENLRGECQKLIKIVQNKGNKVNPKTSDKSKGSPRFRIHHLCMLHFNSCLFRSRKSKKNIRFTFRKNLKLKFSEFRLTRPHTKTTYRHQRHLHRYTCATSFVYHPLGVYAREAGAYEGENLQENWF